MNDEFQQVELKQISDQNIVTKGNDSSDEIDKEIQRLESAGDDADTDEDYDGNDEPNYLPVKNGTQLLQMTDTDDTIDQSLESIRETKSRNQD